MGTFSIWHWLIVLAVVLLLFGKGKIPGLMKDLGSGINLFKKGLKEGGDEKKAEEESPKAIDQDGQSTVASSSEEEKKTANG